MNEQEILRELGGVMDELNALPPDAFSERYPLIEHQGELRSLLAAGQLEAGRDVSAAWGEQAARKQPEETKEFVEIHLPDETGGAL